MSDDKFIWKEGDLEIVKLVYKGVEIDIPPHVFARMTPQEQDAYIAAKKGEEVFPKHSGFEAPVCGSIVPKDVIISRDEDDLITLITPEEYDNLPKTPIQAFVCNIVFPKTLDEVLRFYDHGCFNVEDILWDDYTNWTVPNWAKVGDIALFMHSKTAIQTIRKLCTALKNQDKYSEEETAILKEWLDRGRELYNKYGGKIFAYGRVVGMPEDASQDEEEGEFGFHWKARIYADIERVWKLDNPIDISEFNSFLYISRLGSITPVFGEQYEKLKKLILSKNQSAADYFVDSMAAPVPLAKIDETNWLPVANEYRRSFLLEQQFRAFYVDRFLSILGDQKKTFRECRVRKQGIPDSFVDNIILFNGKYLPVEVKLNVDGEPDLPGQVKKYCNDDVRFTDHGAEKAFDKKKSYQDQVLIIDTENVYLYDDRDEIIEHVINLDTIKVVEDIQELRRILIERMNDRQNGSDSRQ